MMEPVKRDSLRGKVFLSLARSMTTDHALAKRLKVAHAKVYDALRGLQARGLVAFSGGRWLLTDDGIDAALSMGIAAGTLKLTLSREEQTRVCEGYYRFINVGAA